VLLAEFGAVTGAVGKPVITPLGRWAAGHLSVGLPALADPGLPPGEMIAAAAQFSDAEQRHHVAWGWLAERNAAEAAREILTTAEELSPLLSGVAVRVAERLGEDALPAWRELAAAPCVGPHARAVLADWDQRPEPSDVDGQWLGVEAAAAAPAGRPRRAPASCAAAAKSLPAAARQASEQYSPTRRCRPPPPAARSSTYQPAGIHRPRAVSRHDRQ